ncbi:MAG: cytochrome c peroxidase [Campylobacterota bacterium]|nr:cytochrome c peroxidase [Campylobacterota bacterium]
MKLFYLLIFFSYCYAQGIYKPLPEHIEYDKKIIDLGRELFFDTILSDNNDISCASCHGIYGADNKIFSIGTDNKIGNINTPTVFNLIYNINFFWNGREDNLTSQIANGPLIAEHEMANDKKTIEQRLKYSKKYKQLFQSAYGKEPSFDNMLHAIAEFEKTLITPNSKFDKYLRGEIKLSKKEQKGLILFESYGCVSCHNGINLGSNSYQKYGAVIEYKNEHKQWDDRYKVTKDPNDIDVFKVPSLRNIQMTPPYFHDGSANNLKNAIYSMAYHNTGALLEEDEVEYIESFLKTLTGELPKTLTGK